MEPGTVSASIIGAPVGFVDYGSIKVLVQEHQQYGIEFRVDLDPAYSLATLAVVHNAAALKYKRPLFFHPLTAKRTTCSGGPSLTNGMYAGVTKTSTRMNQLMAEKSVLESRKYSQRQEVITNAA